MDLSTDIEIFQARQFFINRNDIEKAAIACYYSGKIVDETDNVALEMGYYKEGLELSKKENNEFLQGKILYNMGYIDFEKFWYGDAITQYQQAIKIFNSIGDQHQQEVYSLIAIGNSFIAEEKADNAQQYFNEALYKIQLFDNPTTQVAMYISLMEAYIELKMLDTAKQLSWQALNLVTTDIEKATIYISLAQLFHVNNNNDSARYYIAKAEPVIVSTDDVYELTNIYHLYYQIEKGASNYSKALEYFELYSKYRIELTNWNDRQKLLDFRKKYDNFEKEKQYNYEKNRLWRFAGILCMISFLLIITVFRIKRKNIYQKILLERTEFEKVEIEQKFTALQNMYLKRNNDIQVAFFEKLGIIKDLVLLIPKQLSNIYLVAKVNAVISQFTIQKFIDITNELYSGFINKLKEKFPNASLSELETGVCCLILCGFSNKELSLFIHKKKDTQAIDKMKNRIRKKLSIPAYRDIRNYLLDKIISN